MALDNIFSDANIVMTVVSLITFIGILWWAYIYKHNRDFDAMANLPLVDDNGPPIELKMEKHHV